MKRNLTLLLVLFSFYVQSQNLEQLISNESVAVIEVSGDQIFDLIDHTDFGSLVPPDPSGAPMELNQFGIDINAKAYYFYQVDDSIGYHNMIVGITDVAKAEELIKSSIPNPTKKVGGYDFAIQSGMSAGWNNTQAIFSYTDFPKKVYTMDDLLEEKEAERIANESSDAPEIKGDGEEMEDEELDLDTELLLKNMYAEPLYTSEEMTDRMMDHFTNIIGTQSAQSIARLAKYTSGKMNNSSAYFWLNSINDLIKDNSPLSSIESFFPELASMIPEMDYGMESVAGNLIFGEDEIRFDTKVEMSPNLAPIMGRMYKSKMEKSFFKHFNQDEVLGYMNYTMDMATWVKEYPEMIKAQFGGGLVEMYNDEMILVLDLIEVILDEEAIGELVTGDMMMLLHDFENQEVTYKTTEYDDDFNATEVERTKMESTPIFSVMLGSQNESFVARLMKLARKYEMATSQGNYHSIASKKMGAPFDVYFTHNDGIVFFTNSKKKVGNYATGSKDCNLGKHKKNLKNNILNMYLDASSTLEHLSSMMPVDPKTLDYIKANYKEMFVTIGEMEGNRVSYDMVIKTNGAKGNSLKLIFDSMATMQGLK